MFDLGNLKKFLYSQQAYTALRMTLGTMLPGVVIVLVFDQILIGLSCALGAFCTSFVDVPAPLWRKHRHMLFGTMVIGVVSLMTMLASPHPIALWCVVLGVSFVGGLVVAYGVLSTAMGLAAMMSMALMLAQRHAGTELWPYLIWLVAGGLWYTYFCLLMCRVFQDQMARRALAECLFATADYLTARSQFYMPAIPLDECHSTMIKAQVAVVDAQQAARDLVLNNLFVGQRVIDDAKRIRLFNILTDVVDLHDSVLAMHVNFETLRSDFVQTDALDFMRDLLHKTGRELARIAEVVVTGKQLLHRFNIKAELRALEYEVSLAHGAANASILRSAYIRGRTISAMTDKLIEDLDSTTNTTDISTEMIEKRYYLTPPRREPIHWSSPALRYAVRLTMAMALGMMISEYIGGKSAWIVITIMVVIRPGFGLTQERNKHRLVGTMLGCMITPIIFWGVDQQASIFWIMAGSFLLSFSFMRLHYLTSVFFITIGMLMLYHFMAPGETLVEQRVVDTLIGTLIGALAVYVFPTWEYQLLAPQIASTMRNSRRYVAEVFAPVFSTIDYRLARRDALVALTGLSAAYQRMLQDPVAKQHQVDELGTFVLQCNLLLSEIAALAHIRSDNALIVQTPAFRETANKIRAALTLRLPSDNHIETSCNELSSAGKSAVRIMQISRELTLPGMSGALKSLR